MGPPSAHLLRTVAAVPPGARVVDLACGDGRHLDPLARLGFDVWGATAGDPGPARARLAETVGVEQAARRVVQASPHASRQPGASADWVVLSDASPASMAEAERVLRPGGWVWAEGPSAQALDAAAQVAGLLAAEEPAGEGGAVHAIYRKPGSVA